jgi:hypothetical protein
MTVRAHGGLARVIDACVVLTRSLLFCIAGHADQHHTGGSLVEDRSHLFEAVHLEAIGLVHKD